MTKQKDKIKISSLQKNKNNPRYITADKLEKLKASIESFEQMLEARPIVTDEDGVILGGNMRFEALKALGYKEIPAAWVKTLTGLTDEQKREFLIKDNVGFGAWDWDTLANEWESELLTDWGLDVPVMEYEEQTELEAKEDDYQAPENMKIDVMQGDLIEFKTTDGRTHRLLCGDSTNSDDVEKLMQGKKADLIFTDPPYNGRMGKGGFKDSPKLEKLANKLKGNIESLYSFEPEKIFPILEIFKKDKISIFLFCNKNLVPNYLNFALDTSRKFDILTWHKENFIPANNNTYFPDTEYLIKIKDSGAVFNTGLGSKVRYNKYWILNSPKEDATTQHPTVKPQQIISDCILICSKNNDLILDLFLGSGSTLVAAHQLKRTCYGLELEPKYCQVIIDRMQKLDNSIKVTINGKAYEQQAEKIPF